MNITVGVPTKDRYGSLDKTLLSIALQTYKPIEVIIVDDSVNPVDIREISHYEYILRLLSDKGIEWRVIWGAKKGQHYSHQLIQEEAKGDWIFRIDDDEVAEPDVLDQLASYPHVGDGAIAPCVLMPNANELPNDLPRNKMESIESPNMQWFKGTEVCEVEHLYSCFLYKKGIAKYDLSLSTVAHREETIFSHSIYRAGYKLWVNMWAKVYHFRSPGGGIRDFHNHQLWEHDEKIFQGYLDLWGIGQKGKNGKMVILDSGLGDHYAFKNILPELRAKHENITIACCFPEVFHDEPSLKLISIAEAKLMYGNIDAYNIYHFMGSNNWKQSLVKAFRQLYIGNENNNIPLQSETKEREAEPKELSNIIMETGYKLIS
jgi:glycosyltransferase involved in cell wall biosynthesis